ncbi:unnamed protein product [Mucor hiemalis]
MQIYTCHQTLLFNTKSQRITYQINKKQELKKQRAIERLKIYHFDQLEALREQFAKNVIPSKLPGSEKKHFLEVTPQETYLEEKLSDILQLLEDISTVNKENENTTIPALFTIKEMERPAPSEEEVERLRLKKEFKEDYEKVLMESFLEQEKNIEAEYNAVLSVFKQNKENEQPYATIDSY